jgi:hypothetical protein
MIRAYWGAICADFRREYHLAPAQIGALPTWEFGTLLANLSGESAWRYRVEHHAHDVSADEAAAITARLRS